jgi:Ca-activated chloride channel family protein
MLEFAWPYALLALALPWLVLRFVPAAAPVATPLRVPFLHAARAWSQAGAGVRPRARVALAVAAGALVVAAACRPQWIGEPVGVPSSGRSMLLALDVSASMRTAALGPELGLEVMRRTAREFVAARSGDRIGLVVFGSKAYVQSPLTFDLRAVAEMVDESFIGLAGEGTALGDAIALGVARLRAMQRDERVLILLTDGSSTDGTVTVPDAARLARCRCACWPVSNSRAISRPAARSAGVSPRSPSPAASRMAPTRYGAAASRSGQARGRAPIPSRRPRGPGRRGC